MKLQIEVRELGEKEAVIELSGEMDFYSSPRLLKKISILVERGMPFIVIDLSSLDYMDSKVMKLMIRAQERVREVGGDIQLVSPRHSVSNALGRHTGLDKALLSLRAWRKLSAPGATWKEVAIS